MAGLLWAVGQPVRARSAVAARDVGGEQDLSCSSRSRSAARWIRASGCWRTTASCGSRKGFLLGALIGTPLGLLLGLSHDAAPDVRSGHPDPAADFAAGVAAARAGALSEVGAGGALRDCGLLDVADGDQRRGRREGDSAGLLERGEGAAALEVHDVHQDRDPGDAAVPVYRLPAQPRHRVAGHRRERDADGHAGRRRLSLAGVQQPDLRAHPARDPHDRHSSASAWIA